MIEPHTFDIIQAMVNKVFTNSVEETLLMYGSEYTIITVKFSLKTKQRFRLRKEELVFVLQTIFSVRYYSESYSI